MKEREFFVSLCLYADKNLSHGQQVPANAVNGLIFFNIFFPAFLFFCFFGDFSQSNALFTCSWKAEKKIITISKRAQLP